MALAVAHPTYSGLRAVPAQSVATSSQKTAVKCVAPRASLKENVAKAAVAVGVSLALTNPAFAAVVKMGGDDGSLAFVPSSLTVSAGETIKFLNNSGFPHNVVFDEEDVPAGVSAAAISHEEYFNAKGEDYEIKLEKAGKYEYYCDPHVGAGMKGSITVS